MAKPKKAPTADFPTSGLHIESDWLWLPLRQQWCDQRHKPEEQVRQSFIRHLVERLGYSLSQMDQERRIQVGRNSPRADIAVWQTPAHKADGKSPVLVIECKAESVEIDLTDYYQGESYARASGCEFFVAHNSRHTAVFKLVPGLPGGFVEINDIPKATDWGDAKRLKAIRDGQRAFSRKEFQDLLFECHSILRDVHKMDPGRAFDTISKVLFIKMYIERSGLHGTFTTEFLEQRSKTRLPTDPAVHDGLFEQTKLQYRVEELFAANDRLEISEETFKRIVKKLERFDLAETSEDVKGLAFEQFLGTTFRGELGQFFTPRPVVEFMVDVLQPQEGELICDPCAGSGGFLIRAFEMVRKAIQDDIRAQKLAARTEIEALKLPVEDEERRIAERFATLNKELLPSGPNNTPLESRVSRLAWQCVFGTDAEPRAARTAKMNMIMHGDGHGGIHHRDGLVDFNGIFENRFDVVLTNPQFGGNVGRDQKVNASTESRVADDPHSHADIEYRYRSDARYGAAWRHSHARLIAHKGQSILDLYPTGKGKKNRDTGEIFLDRCIQLLKPGGRLGIVLPDGNLNNPSLHWLRRWAEDQAKLMAVVSLPNETFRSADATVKASLVFLRKFTEADRTAWEAAWTQAHAELDPTHAAARHRACADAAPLAQHGGSTAAASTLAALALEGITLTAPTWALGAAPVYPRGIGPSLLRKPEWQGKGRDAARVAALKRDYKTALLANEGEAVQAMDAALAALRKAIKREDEVHQAALWVRVRQLADYPVFAAAPETVGITSTGETGAHIPNQLPGVLVAWRRYTQWLAAGAKDEDTPDFPLPLAA